MPPAAAGRGGAAADVVGMWRACMGSPLVFCTEVSVVMTGQGRVGPRCSLQHVASDELAFAGGPCRSGTAAPKGRCATRVAGGEVRSGKAEISTKGHYIWGLTALQALAIAYQP